MKEFLSKENTKELHWETCGFECQVRNGESEPKFGKNSLFPLFDQHLSVIHPMGESKLTYKENLKKNIQVRKKHEFQKHLLYGVST